MKRKLSNIGDDNRTIKRRKLYEIKEINHYVLNNNYNFNKIWRNIMNDHYLSMVYVFIVEAEHIISGTLYCIKIGYTTRIHHFPRYTEHLQTFYKIIPLFLYPIAQKNMRIEKEIHKKLKPLCLQGIRNKKNYKKVKECYSFYDLEYIINCIELLFKI